MNISKKPKKTILQIIVFSLILCFQLNQNVSSTSKWLFIAKIW